MSAASSRRLAGQSRRSTTIDLAAVLEFAEAERLTDTLLRDIWTGRERAELRAAAERARDRGRRHPARCRTARRPELLLAERIEDGASRGAALCAASTDADAAAAASAGARRRRSRSCRSGRRRCASSTSRRPTAWRRMRRGSRCSPIRGRGRSRSIARAEGGGFRLAATLTRARDDRAAARRRSRPGPLGLFDRANAIEVELFGGALAGLPDIDVLAGGNAAAVMTDGGAWEVLQFAEAELIGPRRYRLTRLLRGQCGSEQAMATGAAAGADFVLLDARGRAAAGARRRSSACRSATASGRRATTTPRRPSSELTIAAEGEGLMPFAPVHLRARRDAASGDIALRWIRRTRFGGDGWELAEVPLNEEREAYRLEILDGATLRRSVELDRRRRLSSTRRPQQAADFGGPATDFTVQHRAAQRRGRGRASRCEEIVNA